MSRLVWSMGSTNALSTSHMTDDKSTFSMAVVDEVSALSCSFLIPLLPVGYIIQLADVEKSNNLRETTRH